MSLQAASCISTQCSRQCKHARILHCFQVRAQCPKPATLLVACATTTARALSTSSSVRLDKFLNDASVAASRAACSKLVKQGRVAVDGVVAKRAIAKVPADGVIRRVVVDPLPLLRAYHKPVGVHSTLSDDRGRPDLAAVAPRKAHRSGPPRRGTRRVSSSSLGRALTHKLLSPRAPSRRPPATCDVATAPTPRSRGRRRRPRATASRFWAAREVDLRRGAAHRIADRNTDATQAGVQTTLHPSATCWRRGSPPTTASPLFQMVISRPRPAADARQRRRARRRPAARRRRRRRCSARARRACRRRRRARARCLIVGVTARPVRDDRASVRA